jgi:hypothetical protein
MSKALVTALCVLGVALAAGCGHATSESRTQLTVVALNEWVGRAVFHLDCEPVGGDVPHPAAACAAIGRDPQLVTRPKPFECWASDWSVTVRGRLDGRAIRRSFTTCWTPQMPTIRRLGLSFDTLKHHLVARRRRAIFAGTTHRFPPGVLRPTDLVTCDILGHRLSTPVPDTTGPDADVTTGFGGAGYTSVVLSVEHESDGSVTASCREGTA